jgi:hypothetical protein
MSFPMRLLPFIAVLALMCPAGAEERQTESPSQQPPAATTTETTTPAPAAPVLTMKDLLNEGYEIKTTSIISHDIVTRGGSTADVDAAMIILQKGPMIATCYTEFSSFANGAFYTLPCNVYK